MKPLTRKENNKNMSDTAAVKIASGVLKVQNAFTQFLSGLTVKWGNRQKKIFLVSTTLFLNGMSIYSIIISFRHDHHLNIASHGNITAPRQIHSTQQLYRITALELRSAKAYKQAHPNLAKERPGLYDSLSLIEKNYYLQKK